ncbi:MAG TPA: CBS domain-containing protein [Polyangiaceae bacterium]|nr:CBS domain-containing protein [Polyangiaceae bacterium]
MASVEDILRQKGSLVHAVEPTALMFEAVEKMVHHNIGALLVVADDELKGIVTERDYLKRVAVLGKRSRTTPVSEVMTENLVTISPNTEVGRCMELMTGRRIRHLPVIFEGRVVGLVSIGDLVKSKLREQDAHIQHLTDYIQGSPSATFL